MGSRDQLAFFYVNYFRLFSQRHAIESHVMQNLEIFKGTFVKIFPKICILFIIHHILYQNADADWLVWAQLAMVLQRR